MSSRPDPWNPDQYLRFAAPRLRPAVDLIARLGGAPRTVVDLGCGTGHVTALLAGRWPAARIIGVDDSEAMLAQARNALPGVEWQRRSVADWQPEAPVELLFSNAALHWLPGHATLLPRLAGFVAPGGTLAVQMPRNFAAPSHTAILETLHDGPWRTRLEPLWRASPVATPAEYFGWLEPFAATLDLWETEYLQVLEGPDAVKEWTKGTWLKPFLDALDEPERSDFEAAYAARVRRAYPPRADGRTLFPFRRLFIVMRR